MNVFFCSYYFVNEDGFSLGAFNEFVNVLCILSPRLNST